MLQCCLAFNQPVKDTRVAYFCERAQTWQHCVGVYSAAPDIKARVLSTLSWRESASSQARLGTCDNNAKKTKRWSYLPGSWRVMGNCCGAACLPYLLLSIFTFYPNPFPPNLVVCFCFLFTSSSHTRSPKLLITASVGPDALLPLVKLLKMPSLPLSLPTRHSLLPLLPHL